MILGIDPGLEGAFALVDVDKCLVETYAMPTFTITVNNKKKKQLDCQRIRQLFDYFSRFAEAVIMEEPHALPSQGVTSMFNFGRVCGTLHMACVACLTCPLTLVRPYSWKQVLGLTADKDSCRKRAGELFPSAAAQWAMVKDDGRAEAALLAFYHFKMGKLR